MRSLSMSLVLLFCVAPRALAQAPILPSMTLDRTSLSFGAVTTGALFASQTSAQTVRVTQGGAGSVTWAASSSQPWLQASPAFGAGSGAFSVSVNPRGGFPTVGTLTGSIVLSYSGANTTTATISVTLRLLPYGTSARPYGYVDTPLDNAVGVTGAVPFTGWALDDVEIAGVSLCRAAVLGEPVGADGRCGGAAQIFVGNAVFIEGARPDVQMGFPTYPRNSRAGWGLMVLTNTLPAQGNGTYPFFIWARDVEGAAELLGTRTLMCDNDHATLPFGTIDTPGQGETVSGNTYVNFGWALTQNPKYISTDISTLMVYVDGQPVGAPSYGYYRSDIATIFPGLANSDGAVGYRVLDTTLLTDGLHTIVWTATDSGGFSEGLGSRYFIVSNGSAQTQSIESAFTRRSDAALAAATAASDTAPAVNAATLATVPLATTAIHGRRGWAADAAWQSYAVNATGQIVVHAEELDRVALQLSPSGVNRWSGYLRVGASLQPLPVGSHLAAETGRFTWAPGVGFVGTYDLVFLRGTARRGAVRQEVRIVLRPKNTGPADRN